MSGVKKVLARWSGQTARVLCLTGAFFLYLCPSTNAAHHAQGNPPKVVLVAAADLLHDSQPGGEALFVDVRQAGPFSRLRIPRSLNIPLFAVKTKAFLRDKAVILVNDGFQSAILEQECRTLQAGGMKSVRVLDGGIASWAVLGGPLEGEAAALREIRLVSPDTFAAEKAQRLFVSVFIDGNAEKARQILPETRQVSFGEGGEGFLARLEEALPAADDGRTPTILLVDDTGSTYSRLQFLFREKRFQGTAAVNFFFLQGGIEGFREFQERQVALLKGKGKLSVGGCPDCPQGRSQ